MSKKSLFTYAILYHERVTTKEGEEIKTSVLGEPKTALSTSGKQIGMIAAREIPEDKLEYLDDIEIVVRPF